MTARVTTPRPAPGTRGPALPALLLGALLGLGLATARADTPEPAHPPGPPLTATTPAPPVLTGETPSSARASTTPSATPRAPLPQAPSAASTLGLAPAPLSPAVAPDAPAAAEEPAGLHATEPKVEHLVTEDSSVRIEEERVRSQTTRIVVKSKIPGMGSYEIAPRDLTRDAASDPKAGKRIWLNIGF